MPFIVEPLEPFGTPRTSGTPLRERPERPEPQLHDRCGQPACDGDERIAVESRALRGVFTYIDSAGRELVDFRLRAQDGLLAVGGIEAAARRFDNRLPQLVRRNLAFFEIESGP